ncbi:cell wall metabolism sensor histidine kinase WalK [Halobacillus sp. ACCC02827]|uniref:cell wall metabolism sensor histidine kinase WalK n=1 Tax=Bacillaceae TaxID=186817 RepID=UPI0002A4F6CD|nr:MULTISPECIES: cell wall metabolism sensor histidine kinase WalK [Bacillaceae]ELK47377.1 two-component sensor histidine kinase [Halobacillus sp. BAB-2008]QHT48542.1 cell wall metabolism sensor histidine kinase WalK [Bacillus sp. SB49]WJE15777.1 cell wall metabolism sensor histidine kinase WalK [Halobacillus sp. ACCC02827]
MKKVGFFQSVRLKLILVYILLLLLGIQVIGAYFVKRLEDQLTNNFESSVESQLNSLTFSLQNAFSVERDEDTPSLASDVNSLLYSLDDENIRKLWVVDNSPNVIAAFGSEDGIIGKKVTDTRITKVFILGEATEPRNVRDSETNERLYVGSRPITNEAGNEIVGVLHYEVSTNEIYEQMQDINSIFAKGTVLAIAVTALLGILVARAITRPLTEMEEQAQIMATGDFSQKVDVKGNDEIGQLGHTFNELNDKLKLSQATTEGERRKLSSVLSNMSDGVIATDRLGAIILMNAPASKLIGRSFEDVQGQSLIDVLDLNDQIEEMSEVEEQGSMIIDLSDEQQQLLLKANFSVVEDENDEMDGFITVISDVTEQEKVEQERREFVSNVSHELRTPLTTMRSYIEALNDGAWQDPEIAPRFLDVTQNETDRMIRLVNDLLQLTKMDHKETPLMKERVEFGGFFHHVIDRFEMNKDEKMTFVRNLSGKDMYVWIDKDKITQVLDNVISNAIKYSPEGGTIRFDAHATRKQLRVSIKDEGIGMPPDTVDKIFDRFYRVDKSRAREMGGTGLGLAIAREMIEAHHGKIWAESKEGKGTTVHFTLPLIQKRRGQS